MKLRLEPVARLALAAWTALTCAYASLCQVPFAWQDFIHSRIYPGWMALFVNGHPQITAAVLALAGAALPRGRARAGWWVLAAAFAVALAWRPLLSLTPGRFSAAVALAGVLPLLAWEAVVAAPRLRRPWAALEPGGQSARLRAALLAALICGAAAWLGAMAFPPRLVAAEALAALPASVAAHAGLFLVVCAALEAARALWSRRPASEAGAELALAWAAGLLLLRRFVFLPLSLEGWMSWALAAAWSAAACAAWAGQGLRASESSGALEPLWAAARPRSAAGRCGALAAAAAVIVLARPALGGQDWNGLLAGLLSVGAWLLVFCALRPSGGGASPSHRRAVLAALAAVAGLVGLSLGAAALDPELRPLDAALGPAASEASQLSPALKLALAAMSGVRGQGDFFAFLQAHTNLPRDSDVRPIDIKLVDQITDVPDSGKPNIFIVVIDSLRRDYVGAFNPKVTFTPHIDALARDGAFAWPALASYGGTGLSEPSIWAGSMLIHKQYVLPFAPMDSLLKLVQALHYERWVTMDVLLDQLIDDPLIKRVNDNDGGLFTTCQTLSQLDTLLDSRPRGAPLFFYTQPQDIHISVIDHQGRTNVTGKRYDGFDAAYASRLERLDGCLGKFVDGLKRRGLYDDSIIVVTADHGDALGEDGRYGHAYFLTPEVLRVPLVMRVPSALRSRLRVDADGPAYLTDLTPTLYQILGQGSPRLDPLLGRPLASFSADPKAWRKPEQLVAASYGPIWGVVRDGRRLFTADAIDFKYRTYDLASPVAPGLQPSESEIDEGKKALKGWIDRLDALWGVPPR